MRDRLRGILFCGFLARSGSESRYHHALPAVPRLALPIDDLKQLSLDRFHLLWPITHDYGVPETARLVGYIADWPRTIIHLYNKDDLTGLVDCRQHYRNHTPLLTRELRNHRYAAWAGRIACANRLWTAYKGSDGEPSNLPGPWRHNGAARRCVRWAIRRSILGHRRSLATPPRRWLSKPRTQHVVDTLTSATPAEVQYRQIR